MAKFELSASLKHLRPVPATRQVPMALSPPLLSSLSPLSLFLLSAMQPHRSSVLQNPTAALAERHPPDQAPLLCAVRLGRCCTHQLVAAGQLDYRWAGRTTTRYVSLQNPPLILRPRPTETTRTPRTGIIISIELNVQSITCWRRIGQPNAAIMLCLLSTDKL